MIIQRLEDLEMAHILKDLDTVYKLINSSSGKKRKKNNYNTMHYKGQTHTVPRASDKCAHCEKC